MTDLTEDRIEELRDTFGVAPILSGPYDDQYEVKDLDWAVEADTHDESIAAAKMDAERVAIKMNVTLISFIPNGGGGWPTVGFRGEANNIFALLDAYDNCEEL